MTKRVRTDGGIKREDYEHQERMRESGRGGSEEQAGSWQDQKVSKDVLSRRKIVKVRRRKSSSGATSAAATVTATRGPPRPLGLGRPHLVTRSHLGFPWVAGGSAKAGGFRSHRAPAAGGGGPCAFWIYRHVVLAYTAHVSSLLLFLLLLGLSIRHSLRIVVFVCTYS